MKEKGSSLVEFAIAITLFFTVLFAIIDFSYLYWVNLTMQHAVREGARYAVVGRTDLDPTPQGTAQDKCDAAIQEIKNQSMGLYDTVSAVVTLKTMDANGNFVTLPANTCWSANQIILIDLDCSVPLLTPYIRPFFTSGVYKFSVSATMKNENFK